MKNKLLTIIALLFVVNSFTFAQPQKVYDNIEFTAPASNLQKPENWVIFDKLLLIDILDRLVYEEGLYSNNVKLNEEQKHYVVRLVNDGLIYVKIQKRLFDDNIKEIQFILPQVNPYNANNEPPVTKLDEITDHLYLREVWGDRLYYIVLDKNYIATDLTWDPFESPVVYEYDLYLHALEPRIMFFNTTSDAKVGYDDYDPAANDGTSASKVNFSGNKYTLSLFGKWGNEFINFPGWYFSTYVLGAEIYYSNQITNPKPRDKSKTYAVRFGIGQEINQPFAGNNESQQRKLYNSGFNAYINLSGNPVKIFNPRPTGLLKNLDAEIEYYFTMTEEKPYINRGNYYSVRSYGTFSVTQDSLLALYHFGDLGLRLGASMFTLAQYMDTDFDSDEVAMIGSEDQYMCAFGELFVSKFSALLQHKIGVTFNYNFDLEYGYLGLKVFTSLSNTLGVDFRFYSTLMADNQPYWQQQTYYIVFSPVLRIVY